MKRTCRYLQRALPVRIALVPVSGLMLFTVAYELVMLLAAFAGRKRHPEFISPDALHTRFAVVVPARDEAGGIGGVLQSLTRFDYPADQYEVFVVADNCSDQTAALARQHGATVLERFDAEKIGKGHALAWAFEKILSTRPDIDVISVIDADCTATPNLLTAFAARMSHGAKVVQAEVRVSNPDESWTSALRFGAFSLINLLRPSGKAALNLSCGLYGTGMAFRRSVLDIVPWDAHSLAEDGEYHFRLVDNGIHAEFAPEAAVLTPMPTTLGSSGSQHLRWEGGRWEHIRLRSRSALMSGLKRRDPHQINAAIEPFVLPQAILAVASLIVGIFSIVARSRLLGTASLATVAGHAVYVFGGLRVTDAPASVYRAALLAPVLVVWKLLIWLRILTRREPTVWVRSWREHDEIAEREVAA